MRERGDYIKRIYIGPFFPHSLRRTRGQREAGGMWVFGAQGLSNLQDCRGHNSQGSLVFLRVVTWSLNMAPYLLERVLKYGTFICAGYIRGIEGLPF